jgi:hypothetical protein
MSMTRLTIALIIIYSVIIYSVALSAAFGQTQAIQTSTIHLSIIPTFGANTIAIGDSTFQANDAHHAQIDVLKFYISCIQFLHKGAVVLEEEKRAVAQIYMTGLIK